MLDGQGRPRNVGTKHIDLPQHRSRRLDANGVVLLQCLHMHENLAQLFRKRRLLIIRQLQPCQLCDFFNFLFRYLHVSLSFPLFKDVQNGLPARPQGVRRLRRTFLNRPPRTAKTALSPVGTSQGDGRQDQASTEGTVLTLRHTKSLILHAHTASSKNNVSTYPDPSTSSAGKVSLSPDTFEVRLSRNLQKFQGNSSGKPG